MEAQTSSPRTTLFILLGASEWPQFPEFGSSKAFANAAGEVKDYFLDPERFGIPSENALDTFDSKNTSDELDAQIGQFLEQRLAAMKANGQEARDLLVYFVGHGGFVGRDSDFYLAIRRTRMENPRASGLSMLALADTLTEKARFLRRIIILDCCFAAAAFSAFQAEPTQVAIEKTIDAFAVKQRRGGFPSRGTTLLCSSGHKSPSRLLPDGSSTMFTKAVLEVLAEGITSQQDRLSLREVKDLTADVLSETRDAPKPTVLSPDQSEGDVADIPFFPNPYLKMERTRLAEEERHRQVIVVPTPSTNPPLSSSPTVEPFYTEPIIHKQQTAIAINQARTASLPQPVARNTNFFTIGSICLLLVILIGGSILFAVNHRNPSTSTISASNCTKVGILLPETATSARWDGKDKPALEADISAISGITYDYYNAQGDSAAQQNQADRALAKGDCILVVAPNDSAASAAIVTKAKAFGVPVIAYDRIIQSKDLSYYVSFDNEKVGQLQGQYILDHYKDYIKGTGKNNIVLINSAQADQNAILFNSSVEETLKPLFDTKTLNKVYDQFTPNWDNPTAETEMEAALIKNNNNIQIAYVANDGMAATVIAALKAQHLSGKVLVTGQDATDAGIHNILTGDQAMTVYKAIIKEAQATADIVKALHDGTTPTTTTTSQTTDGGSIPTVLETPVAVDKTNILTTVVKDTYIDKSVVCAGLPAGDGRYC